MPQVNMLKALKGSFSSFHVLHPTNIQLSYLSTTVTEKPAFCLKNVTMLTGILLLYLLHTQQNINILGQPVSWEKHYTSKITASVQMNFRWIMQKHSWRQYITRARGEQVYSQHLLFPCVVSRLLCPLALTMALHYCFPLLLSKGKEIYL